MSKYIDAEKAIKGIQRALPHAEDTDEAERVIRSMPAADVQEVRHGRWIYLNGWEAFECSVCGRQMVRNIFDYCPWCGAKMDEEENK